MATYNILLCLPEDASYRSYQGIRCCMSGSITTIALTKLFTNHHHHQTRPSDISSDFSHQMSSRLLIQVSLISLSLRFRFREPLLLLWDSVMCSADEIRFRYLALSPFFLRNSDFPMRFYLLLQSRMSADCAGEASLASGAQTAGAGRHSRLTGREQQLQVMAGRKM